MTTFSSFSLSPALVENLSELGYQQPTEIQALALPQILAGKDVLAQAKTGSGKTAAFALGLLNQINLRFFGIQALVLCPTRELAEQVADEIRQLGRKLDNLKVLTVFGGAPMSAQINSLAFGAHVVVGTPGRLVDLLSKQRLQIEQVRTLVLDEADRMLDMGFEEDMQTLIQALPAARQTLLFSATYPAKIQLMSEQVQQHPEQIRLQSKHTEQSIEQVFFEVETSHKSKAAAALLSHYQPKSAILFCNTKALCQQLCDDLQEMGFIADALHGDLEQRERQQVLVRFSQQSLAVLIATDVAARGLDVQGVDLVISVNPAFEPDVHVHRIGRTGRAQQSGMAATLCAPSEAQLVSAIETQQGHKLTWKGIASMRFHANRIVAPEFQSIMIDGGKKAKLRPGDILGALTQDAGLPAEDVGNIKITATHSYVAIKLRSVKPALRHLRDGKIKTRKFRARKLA